MQCVWNAKGVKIHQHSTLYLSKQQSTQTGCYAIAACFPFEPLEKCMTFKDIFPGLSRTLSFNFHDFCRTKVIFQDFPGPGIFKKKIQDFPGGVGTLRRYWTHDRKNAYLHLYNVFQKSSPPQTFLV